MADGPPTLMQLTSTLIAKIVGGIIVSIIGLLTTVYIGLWRYALKKEVKRIDELEKKVADLEKNVPSRDEMNNQFDRMTKEIQDGIRSVHERMDQFITYAMQSERLGNRIEHNKDHSQNGNKDEQDKE
jgi:peptidoglycan hydrolase CwlO-like protein